MTDQPTIPDLPTAAQLRKSTAIAAAVAAVILVVAVLPAEYGIDPTGIGGLLGLKRMGEIKERLAAENAAHHETPVAPVATSAPTPTPAPVPAATETPATAAPVATTTPAGRNDVTRITLQPGQGREVKLAMRSGARATFSWSVDRGAVSFDLHTDKPDGKAHSYRKGRDKTTDEGEFVAIIDGLHGWFWRNRSSEPLTITLRTGGDYTEVRELD